MIKLFLQKQPELTISIETDKMYIICRAWEWNEIPQSEIKVLKEELLLLKALANRDQKDHLFYSKYSLPSYLKLWLTIHAISFKESA